MQNDNVEKLHSVKDMTKACHIENIKRQPGALSLGSQKGI